MADNQISHIVAQLELIRETKLSEQELVILDAIAHGLQGDLPQASAEAARQLDSLCPSLEMGEEAQDYLWMVWELIMDIVQISDVDSENTNDDLKRLADILQNLQQHAKGELNVYGVSGQKRVWKDLPLLPTSMETSFHDPTLDPAHFTPESVQSWRNTNMFVACCLGAGVIGAYAEAMDALRAALEEEPSTVPEMGVSITECRIQVACGWIVHGGKPLFWWARNNIGCIDVGVEDTANYVEGGSLYQGTPTMCLQRWEFWRDRLEELGREDSGLDAGVRKLACEAAQTMKKIESTMAHTLLV